jgi:hypothetical protein
MTLVILYPFSLRYVWTLIPDTHTMSIQFDLKAGFDTS